MSAVKIFKTIVGAVIYGASLGIFLAPFGIAPGGVSGISVMLDKFLPLGVGSFIVMLNVPLLAVAFKKWGWRFTASTSLAIFVSGAAADICALLPPMVSDPLPAAVFGGALMGLGCGIVFRAGSTTGGTDIAARLVRLRYPYLKTGTAIMMIDGVISLLSGIVFANAENALFSLLALAVNAKVLDYILYGSDGAKLLIIISSNGEKIADMLVNEKNVGCTLLSGVSGYKRKSVSPVLCAVRKQLFPSVRSEILQTDPHAFILVCSAGEIFGEGFKTELSDLL